MLVFLPPIVHQMPVVSKYEASFRCRVCDHTAHPGTAHSKKMGVSAHLTPIKQDDGRPHDHAVGVNACDAAGRLGQRRGALQGQVRHGHAAALTNDDDRLRYPEINVDRACLDPSSRYLNRPVVEQDPLRVEREGEVACGTTDLTLLGMASSNNRKDRQTTQGCLVPTAITLNLPASCI